MRAQRVLLTACRVLLAAIALDMFLLIAVFYVIYGAEVSVCQ